MMSEHDYAIGIYEDRIKQLRSFVESIEVFQYYSAGMEERFGPNMSCKEAKERITQLESAIKRLGENNEK